MRCLAGKVCVVHVQSGVSWVDLAAQRERQPERQIDDGKLIETW
jgi:hypothetical protein